MSDVKQDFSFTGSLIGTIIGLMGGGAAGAVIGGAVGGLFGSLLPITTSEIAAKVVTGIAADRVKYGCRWAWDQMNYHEQRLFTKHLQTAFQEAYREGVYDIGGSVCFRKQRGGVFDDEWDYVFLVDVLKQHNSELAKEVRICLQALAIYERAHKANVLAEVIPKGLTTSNGDHWTLEFFNRSIVTPFLGSYRPLVKTLKELDVTMPNIFNIEKHLEDHLYERTRLHSVEKLTMRPEAWRQFTLILHSATQSLLRHELELAKQERSEIQHSLGNFYDFVVSLNLESLSEDLSNIANSLTDLRNRQDFGFRKLMKALQVRDRETYELFEAALENSMFAMEKRLIDQKQRESELALREINEIASELVEWKDAHNVVQKLWLAIGAVKGQISILESDLESELKTELITELINDIKSILYRNRRRFDDVSTELGKCLQIINHPTIANLCYVLSEDYEWNTFVAIHQMDHSSQQTVEHAIDAYIDLDETVKEAMEMVDRQIMICTKVIEAHAGDRSESDE